MSRVRKLVFLTLLCLCVWMWEQKEAGLHFKQLVNRCFQDLRNKERKERRKKGNPTTLQDFSKSFFCPPCFSITWAPEIICGLRHVTSLSVSSQNFNNFFFSLTRTASVLKSELRSVVPIRPPLAILSSSPALYCNGIDHGSIRLLSKANRTPHQYSAHWLHLALTLPPSAKTQPISALCVCVCVLQI